MMSVAVSSDISIVFLKGTLIPLFVSYVFMLFVSILLSVFQWLFLFVVQIEDAKKILIIVLMHRQGICRFKWLEVRQNDFRFLF